MAGSIRAATGTIRFTAVVQDEFDVFAPSGDRPLNEHDELVNCTTVAGDVLREQSLALTGFQVVDDSHAFLQVPLGTFSKSVFAVNGSTTFTSPPLIAPGETVT